MPLFRKASKTDEGRKVRLWYGSPASGLYMDTLSIAQAFSLQANAAMASTLLGENHEKKYRVGGSYNPSDTATTVKLEALSPEGKGGEPGRALRVAVLPRLQPVASDNAARQPVLTARTSKRGKPAKATPKKTRSATASLTGDVGKATPAKSASMKSLPWSPASSCLPATQPRSPWVEKMRARLKKVHRCTSEDA